ncbi:MAG: hypothetical protein FWH29_10780 [Methanobrevibacter sp.]|nr:hypothetical protein [Methanobrevibacter sp.]
MDDKTKKRIELIKKYNKNISGEKLEKKLKHMEIPEEYSILLNKYNKQKFL